MNTLQQKAITVNAEKHILLVRFIMTFFICLSLFSCTLSAQHISYFGKIKPQYQTFTWNSLQARSFDIYYHEGGEYLGQFAGVVLEEGVKSTQRILGFAWNERLPIIIYNSPNEAAQTNAQEGLLTRGVGGINDIRKNRMVVAFRGDWEEFRTALRRELALNMINMLYYGVNVPSPMNGQLDLPIWFAEGLAEYISMEGISAETDMLVRDMIINEQFTAMSSLEGYARVKMGQMLFNHIADKFGTSKIAELLTRARSMGTVEGAFRATFGVTIEGFTTIWKRELKEQYIADANKYEDIEKISQQRLTDASKDGSLNFAMINASPAFSPSGDRLAYLSARDGAWAVYVQDLRAKKTDILSRVASTGRTLDTKYIGTEGLSIAWKPETGTKGEAAQAQVAFITQGGGSDGISLVNPQSGSINRLDLAYKIIRSLSISPDGKTLAFVAVENELNNIYLYDFATKKISKLTNDVFTENQPTWSPDGKMLFFISDRGSILTTNVSSATFSVWEHDIKSSDVYAISLSTKKIERLTNDSYARKTGLQISPDGKKLLILSDRNGITNLYEWNITAKTLIPRTNLLAGIHSIGLQRDGGRVGITAIRKGSTGIFLLQSPFDRKTKEPEPTELRKQVMERESVAEKALGRAGNQPSQAVTPQSGSDTSIVAGVSKDAPSVETPSSYGKYDVDFSKQKMVEPNPDAAQRATASLVAEQNDYTKPGKLETLPYQYSLDLDSYTVSPTFDTFFGFQASDGSQQFFNNIGISGQGIWQDIMGNNRLQIYANAMFNINFLFNNDLAATYSYLPELLDYEFSLFRTARIQLVYESQTRSNIFARLVYWGGAGKVMLPLGSGMRAEGKLSIVNTIRESIDPSFTRIFDRSEFMVVPELRFVLDNTETGFFGSISGAKAFAKIEAVPGLGGLTFARAIGDYRQYIPLKNIGVIAARASFGTNVGSTPQTFALGGEESMVLGRTMQDISPFSGSEGMYFAYLASPLRGFPLFAARGNNFASANLEARINLLQPDGGNSMLNNIINGLQGVVFVDAGAAWTNPFRFALATQKLDAFGSPAGYDNGDIFTSFGFGVRTNLLGQYPVKIDLAFQNLQSGISRPSLIIGFGYNF